ncbi:MAG: DNA-3-methyladenine glycosylase 2 family protein [Polyangiaceae bacterium]
MTMKKTLAKKKKPTSPTPEEARAHLRKVDKTLAKLIDRVGPYALATSKAKTTFEALARSIVFQQLNGKAASTIFARLVETVGGELTAEALMTTSDEELRVAGLSRNKRASVRDLAARTLAGEIPSLVKMRKMENEAIISALTEVRGIGRWTVEMLLMFRLGRGDVLPVSDYGVRKGFMLAYGLAEMPTPDHLSSHGEKWSPHRTAASWYLWRATELPPTK